MNAETNSLEGIFDIEPPLSPVLYELESTILNVGLTGLLIIGLVLISASLVWYYYYSTKGMTRRKILTLHKNFSAKKINNQHAACQLSRIIQDSLGSNQTLKHVTLPAELESHKERWGKFTSLLSMACYSHRETEPEKMSRLFDDACFWIKSWPRGKNG